MVFDVRYGKLLFGDGKIELLGITTGQVRVANKMYMGGFGQRAFIDEAKTMEMGVIEMAQKHNLMIVNKVCSWAFAKAIVQQVPDNFLYNFKPSPAATESKE